MKASPQLILASGSTRRRELLYQIGLEPDKITVTDIDETPLANEKPADLVHRLAVNKMVEQVWILLIVSYWRLTQ